MRFPGDGVIEEPDLQTTHALTIEAPAAAIWPWLVQIGQGRAGFYSDSRWWDAVVDAYYRLLSREQRCPPVRYERDGGRIVPEWQGRRVGDVIPDGPAGTAFYVVRAIQTERNMVLFTNTHLPHMLPASVRGHVSAELTVDYLLVPVAPEHTRMLRRMRMACRPAWFRWMAVPVVWFWGERITARKFLRGLARRAERSRRDA